jgi:hypothetical protein
MSDSYTWTLVTAIDFSGTPINNPWTGTKSSVDAPEVHIPLNTIPGGGDNGENLELKFEWTDGGNTYQRFFKGFNLSDSFNLSKPTSPPFEMTTVDVQVKTSESDPWNSYTVTPHGPASWEWSFAIDTADHDLNYAHGSYAFVASHYDTDNKVIGIFSGQGKSPSLTWSYLKLYVKQDQVVTATGAPLKIIPNFSLNNLI